MSAGPVVAVMGPTASGKSALALALAERFDGEIVSADSAQVYRGPEIGTARPSAADLARVPHHLLDLRDLDEDFSLAEFQRLATAVVEDLHARGKVPFLAGGTGLYVRGFLEGYTLVEAPPDPELRRALDARDTEDLVAELQVRDPETAARVDPRNRRRLVRALEVCRQAGRPFSELSRRHPPDYRVLKLALRVPRELLWERIDRRLEAMVRAGWVEEVRALAEKGAGPALRRLRILGYPELLDVVEGTRPLEEALEEIRRATRRYAKRQETWLRAEPGAEVLEAGGDPLPEAERRVRRFLQEARAGDPPDGGGPDGRDPERRNPPCS